MIEIESLSDFVNSEQYLKLVSQIYVLLNSCKNDFYNLDNWFFDHFLKKIEKQKAEILFVRKQEQIVGILCFERSIQSQIICLFVKEGYRRQQIGTALLETSFSILQTNVPKFICPINKLNMYKPFINKYKWKANIS